MAVIQLSVPLGHAPGTLSRLIGVLEREDITIQALFADTTAENGIARLITGDPDRAAAVLEGRGFAFERVPVLAARVPCHPGGMNAILKPLAKAQIEVLYFYTAIERTGGETTVILGVDSLDEARRVLGDHWIVLCEDEAGSV